MSQLSTLRVLRPDIPKANPFEINRRVIADRHLDPAAKLVCLAVLDHARHGESSCTASNGTIAKETSIGVRQVITHIQTLVKHGWLDLERLGPTIHHGRVLRMSDGVQGRADPLCNPPQTPLCTALQTGAPTREYPPLPQWEDKGLRKGPRKRPASPARLSEGQPAAASENRPLLPGEAMAMIRAARASRVE